MTPIKDIRIVVEGGHRRLRFTAMMANVGQGHFEVRGSRSGASDPTMSISQVLYNSAGGSRTIATNAWGQYAGDGHDHWHVQQMMSYGLWPVGSGTSISRGAKVGFCFLDTNAWNLSLPGARQSSYYRESWCGTQASTTNRVGISLGWADSYPWSFAYQWVDITGLPAGEYYLRSIVDESDYFVETSDSNNCAWNRIRIPASGSSVTLIGSGSSCIGPTSAVAFPGQIRYATPRRVTFAAGEHVGHRFTTSGVTTSRFPATLASASSAYATFSSTIPGRAGRWFYISNGLWAGSWMQESARVVGAPLPANADAFPNTDPTASTARVALAAGNQYGYQFTAAGATIAAKWAKLGAASGARVDQRGFLPGRSGRWVHVINGTWADYWFLESATAVFNP